MKKARVSQSAKTVPKWRYKAEIITACTCDWGCPCTFNAPPTYGSCEGGWALKIRQGTCGDERLDGLHFAYLARWPRAIHFGQGKAKLFIDAAASERQRRILEGILKGQLGGNPWSIFAKTIDEWLDTSFVPFEWKFDGERSYYKAGKDVLATLEPMTNPVTGKETSAKVVLPDGLVCKELNKTSTRTFAVFAEGLKFAAPGKDGWYGTAEHGS